MFPVASFSTTDTIFELSRRDASFMAASAVSELPVFVVAPIATAAEPPEVAGCLLQVLLRQGYPLINYF